MATDCGHPPLTTELDLSLVVNQTDDDDDDDVDDGGASSSSEDGVAAPAAADGRRRGSADPGDRAAAAATNVVLVGAACGSGLVMFSGVITAIAYALRSQHRRPRRRPHDCCCCCCCCCCEAGDHGPSPSRACVLSVLSDDFCDSTCLRSALTPLVGRQEEHPPVK